MLLNKLNVRYNTIPIMPILKTRLALSLKIFSQKIQTHKDKFKTLGKPLEKLEKEET